MSRVRDEMMTCDYLRFTVTDFNGIQRGRPIGRAHVAQYLDNGLPVHSAMVSMGPRAQLPTMANITTDRSKHPEVHGEGNVTAKPIASTFHLLPWAGGPKYTVGEVLCETYWKDDTIQEACPRYVARRQLEKLGKMGFSMVSGWEAEFYLMDKQTEKPIFQGCDKQSHLLLAEHEEFYYDMIRQMREGSIEVEGIEVEYGSGQLELVTKPTDGIKGVDLAVNLKQAVKEIAWQRGYQASFMTKPFPDEMCSAMQYNFSVLDTKNYNVMSDRNKNHMLSEFGRYWVAGLIKHAAALTALWCPTVNCYRRIHTPHVPHVADWGYEDRRAFIRTKLGPRGCFLENRLPSSGCNPYLAVAGCIAAGLDGVDKRMKCPSSMDEQAKELPHTLEEALKALRQDDVLTAALGPEFVKWFVHEKKHLELKEFESFDPKDTDPDQYAKEREMYYKFL